jgi:hypothetical protein
MSNKQVPSFRIEELHNQSKSEWDNPTQTALKFIQAVITYLDEQAEEQESVESKEEEYLRTHNCDYCGGQLARWLGGEVACTKCQKSHYIKAPESKPSLDEMASRYEYEKKLKEESNPLSQCCKAPMKVEGHTTHYYSCTKCGKPTDPESNPYLSDIHKTIDGIITDGTLELNYKQAYQNIVIELIELNKEIKNILGK